MKNIKLIITILFLIITNEYLINKKLKKIKKV